MEQVTRDLCEKNIQIMDERFKRDDARLVSLERMQQDFLKLSGQLTEILKNQEKRLDDHDKRLDTLEKKPGVWLDRITGGIVSAVVAALVAFVTARVL